MQRNGDLSWIVPNKIIALPSPVTPGYGRVTHANNCQPRDFLTPFKECNIGAVIRLNEKLYDSRTFEREGITVHGLEFPDGGNPSDSIIARFVQIVDSHVLKGQSVAVHCRAGLGRTGTLIGCYIMCKIKEAGFTSLDSKPLIAWMRICRPGMVVGE